MMIYGTRQGRCDTVVMSEHSDQSTCPQGTEHEVPLLETVGESINLRQNKLSAACTNLPRAVPSLGLTNARSLESN